MNTVNQLSKHLFWDADIAEIDEQKHSRYIIKRVLQYGLFSDWNKLVQNYTLDKIVDTAIHMRDLDKKTASFLALLSGVQKRKFLCYSSKPSTPKHWNF